MNTPNLPHLRLVGAPPPDFTDQYVEVPDFFLLTARGKPVGKVTVQFNFEDVPGPIHIDALAALLKQPRKVELEARPGLAVRLWRALKG